MQGAGLCNNVTDADAIAYILWNTAIRPVLTYGINCIHVSKTCLSRMETLQAKILKAGIRVHKWSRSSPVLKLNIKHCKLRKLRQLLILAPWIWGDHFYAMALVPYHFSFIL